MPCDTVRTYSVEFNKNPDFELLGKAALAIGGTSVFVDAKTKRMSFWHNGSYVSLGNGELKFQEGRQSVVPLLKTAYSKQVVRAAAKRFGLTYTEKAENEAVLRMR